MAIENVGKFEEILRGSEDMSAKLKAAMDAYSGDKTDERAIFENVIAPLAEEAQLPFSFDEALEYAASPRDLDDAEVEAVAGGDCACYFIGGREWDDPGTGGTWACIDTDVGAGACWYGGLGWVAG